MQVAARRDEHEPHQGHDDRVQHGVVGQERTGAARCRLFRTGADPARYSLRRH
jgi:hypothetical protein